MKFSCGKLAVPLDYSQPDGETADVFVVRVRSDYQSQRLGSLLVNPGGPGGSGVNLAAGLVGALSEHGARPVRHGGLRSARGRAVGAGAVHQRHAEGPALGRQPRRPDRGRPGPGPDPLRAVVKACVAKYGSELGHFNTEETARDMDLIRQAVGDAKLNYLGYSYGTRLGAAYAHQFPTASGPRCSTARSIR